MMISGANCLVLDEPTNHLDMESITALNNGLIKFPGVALFSCHDHQFVQTTANRIMEILPELARRFCISPDYLAHIFRKEMNIAFHRYLVLRRLSEAEKMLTGTELSIREIAFHCGFGSISQFNRLFRKEKGCTPGSCRSQNRKCASKN